MNRVCAHGGKKCLLLLCRMETAFTRSRVDRKYGIKSIRVCFQRVADRGYVSYGVYNRIYHSFSPYFLIKPLRLDRSKYHEQFKRLEIILFYFYSNFFYRFFNATLCCNFYREKLSLVGGEEKEFFFIESLSLLLRGYIFSFV